MWLNDHVNIQDDPAKNILSAVENSRTKKHGSKMANETFKIAGIDAINRKIIELYPNQKNHLQANATTKYW